ncbi:MAG: N-acetylglucosamine-6-phosphate deacetylase [Pseudomonadota bacterium]
MTSIQGSLLTPDGWRFGHLYHAARITHLDAEPCPAPEPPYVLPGFVDLHVHGGGGADAMQGTAALRTLLRTHAAHGTTSLLATSVTAPLGEIDAFVAAVAAAMAAPEPGEAALLGAHLEGPFLNPDKLGAQPPFAIQPDFDAVERWLRADVVRLVTLAPEIDQGGALQARLQRAGVRTQVGHSLADAATATRAIRAGAGLTHLFNAMSGLDHRAPGVVGAALAHATRAELIPDLIHVAPEAILAARRAIPGLYAVTDATAGAGMPDGPYPLGQQVAIKAEGAMRLADGTLAGSTLTMDQALRNLVALGLDLDEASAWTSTRPARWLSLTDRGELRAGVLADLVVLDAELNVVEVRIAGRPVVQPSACTASAS